MQTKQTFLKGRSTGYLLTLVHGKGLKWGWCNGKVLQKTISLLDRNTNQSFEYTLGEIRSELSRRPHLPNKKERKKAIDIRKRVK